MGLYEDIENLTEPGYQTSHILDGGEVVPVRMANGPVDSLDDVRSLLPGTLDHNEADVELTNGQSVSVYGVESELTLVNLLDAGSGDLWVFAFNYDDMDGYNAGLDLQTPDVSLRV